VTDDTTKADISINGVTELPNPEGQRIGLSVQTAPRIIDVRIDIADNRPLIDILNSRASMADRLASFFVRLAWLAINEDMPLRDLMNNYNIEIVYGDKAIWPPTAPVGGVPPTEIIRRPC